MQIIWYDGKLSYKKHTLTINDNNVATDYSLELCDVPTALDRSLNEIFCELVENRQTKFVEVLYSGGIDSELVLKLCLINNIPVRAITMRLLKNGIPFNIHDLYYSDKFCRENNVERKIVDLHVESLYDTGKYLDYLTPYYITEPHVASHFWLFEQTTGYPIIGGDYCWPWIFKKIISPQNFAYNCYNKFLEDKGIFGIGNALSHSLDLNLTLMKTHIKVYDSEVHGGSGDTVAKLKNNILKELGINLELRYRSYGWETRNHYCNVFKAALLKKTGPVKQNIIWGQTVANILGGVPGQNDKFK